jgi:hypothetical protein
LLTVRCIIIALTISLLLWVGFLYLRICYGQTNINKLTLKPFEMAFAALLAKLLVEILKVFSTAKYLCYVHNNFTWEDKIKLSSESKLNLCVKFFFIAYEFFYLAFTASIFVEYRILWYFIYFQKTTPFEMLDVKKSEYKKTE